MQTLHGFGLRRAQPDQHPLLATYQATTNIVTFAEYWRLITEANSRHAKGPTTSWTRPLTFNIYDAATGGTRVWEHQIFDSPPTQGHGPKIPVVQGYFNVMLGPVDKTSRSLAGAFSASPRYVEIKVGSNNPIAPRQQILTATFAFKAASAKTLSIPGGGSATAVSVAGNGNVGIGTTSPQSWLNVNGGDLLVNRGATSVNEAGQVAISTHVNTNSALKLGYYYNPGVEAAGVVQAFDAGQPARLLLNPKGGSVGIGTTTPG